MHRWVLSLVVLAGSTSFAGGALVGTHSNAAASSRCHARGRGLFSLPDPRCTPGAGDRAVTQADIGVTICRAGWTESVRPPESVTEPEKRAAMRAYGDRGPLHDYEYDHLIPLELGGAPNDPRNLWPQPGGSPNPKDALENRLNALVCDHRLSLAAAQRAIAGNWVATYRRLPPPEHQPSKGVRAGGVGD
jgi:hypothetical protein